MTENIRTTEDLVSLLSASKAKWAKLDEADINEIVDRTDIAKGKISTLFLEPAMRKLNYYEFQEFVSIFGLHLDLMRVDIKIYPGRCEDNRCINYNDGSWCYFCS